MKAYIEFTLPTDKDDYRLANMAPDLWHVLWDFDQWLRSQIKYHNADLQHVRDQLYEIMQDRGVDLDVVS